MTRHAPRSSCAANSPVTRSCQTQGPHITATGEAVPSPKSRPQRPARRRRPGPQLSGLLPGHFPDRHRSRLQARSVGCSSRMLGMVSIISCPSRAAGQRRSPGLASGTAAPHSQGCQTGRHESNCAIASFISLETVAKSGVGAASGACVACALIGAGSATLSRSCRAALTAVCAA